MVKISISCDWKPSGSADSFREGGIEFEILYNSECKDCDYALDISTMFSEQSGSYPPERRVYATGEPSVFYDYSGGLDEKISSYYPSLIMSWHRQLRKFPQTRLYTIGGNFTKARGTDLKRFMVSGFVSQKHNPNCDGYVLRREILRQQDAIRIPSMVYNYAGKWKGKEHAYPTQSKDESMRESMFHLAIENCREAGYFSEKIIDCFASHTVPLYFGDPRIGETFDTDGIITLKEEDAIEQVNSLTEEDFWSRTEAMNTNFERSKPYWDVSKYACTRLAYEKGIFDK